TYRSADKPGTTHRKLSSPHCTFVRRVVRGSALIRQKLRLLRRPRKDRDTNEQQCDICRPAPLRVSTLRHQSPDASIQLASPRSSLDSVFLRTLPLGPWPR